MATLKDSGDRREFGTGAVRDMAEGKGRMDLIPWDVALNIRNCMMNIYRKKILTKPLDDLLARFETLEWIINSGTKANLPENFEIAAASWIMYHYMYTNSDELCSFIDSQGYIFVDKINQYWARAMVDVSKHFEDGAKKYSDNNWRKGIPVWCYFDSASRHLMKNILGWDDEPHDRAVLWNLMCGAWTSAKLIDDEKIKETDQASLKTIQEASTRGCAQACRAAGDPAFFSSQFIHQNP